MRTTLLLTLLLLAGCRHTTPPPDDIRPVKVTVATSATTVERDFAGMATPANAVNLAFKLSGQILDITVSQGSNVQRGDLLAELDPRDVERQIAADRSAYNEARSQQQRMQRLLEHEAVSRQQAEAADTRFAEARTIYENRLEELAQTRLLAPFNGVIENKYVNKFERITAGQSILRLVAPRTTTVKFTMPESALKVLRDTATRFSVHFDNYRGVTFRARLKDYASTSSDASGFPVALRLVDVDTARYDISPGMSCTITVTERDTVADAVTLPLSAIYAPAEGGTYVWIVDSDSRVSRHSVRLGQLIGRDDVIIDSGVDSGDKVVTAGVNRLTEGERVKIVE